jgi:Hemerythrin HHE cation binding domain
METGTATGPDRRRTDVDPMSSYRADTDRAERSPDAGARPGAAVMIASSAADAAAVRAVESHHAQLAGALSAHVEALLEAVGSIGAGGAAGVEQARERLVGFCAGQLLPHAAAEEGSLYPAASGDQRAQLLVEAMVAEHRVLQALVEQIRTLAGPVRVAAAGNALRVLFEVHLAKENELILPLVAAAPQLSLSTLLAGMHELLGQDDHESRDADIQESGACGGGGACGCGGGDSTDAAPVRLTRT